MAYSTMLAKNRLREPIPRWAIVISVPKNPATTASIMLPPNASGHRSSVIRNAKVVCVFIPYIGSLLSNPSSCLMSGLAPCITP
jgi:hypothetical protein